MARAADDVIRERVQHVLDTDKGMRGYRIKVDVVDGAAYLTGIVDTLSEKRRLSDIVKQVEGVKDVGNNVSISTDGYIDDGDVAAEVEEELNTAENVNRKHVGAEVKGGTVFLKGWAESEEEEHSAMDAASKARGVRRVVSNLKKGRDIDDLSSEEIFHSQVNNDGEPNPLD